MNSNQTRNNYKPILRYESEIIDFQADLLRSASSPSYPSIFLDKNNYKDNEDPNKTPLVINGKIVNDTNVCLTNLELDEMETQFLNENENKKEHSKVFIGDITKNKLYIKRMQRKKEEAVLYKSN